MGLLNLVLVVPVLIFVTIYFFMRHAEEFRSHRASPFQRQWTDYARWSFREFNELPHQFKARMSKAQAGAEAYVRCTRPPSPVLDALLRCVKYVAGSILAVLLVVALFDETPLLYVKIQEKNLLWYLAFFGFVFAVADNSEAQHSGPSSSQLPSLQTAASAMQMHNALMRLVQCTHYLPLAWRSPAPLTVLAAGNLSAAGRSRLRQHFLQIRSELLRNFFIHRIQVLAEELVGVVLAPLLLTLYLPQAAPDIVELVRDCKHSSPNFGDWCAFGCLDTAKHGSELYGGRRALIAADNSGTPGPWHSASPRGGGRAGPTSLSNGGKMEKSAISFVLAHRVAWQAPDPLEEASFSSGLGFGASRGRAARFGLQAAAAPGVAAAKQLIKPFRPGIAENMRRKLSLSFDRAQRGSLPAQAGGGSSIRTVRRTAPAGSEVSIPLLEFMHPQGGSQVLPPAAESGDAAGDLEADWGAASSSSAGAGLGVQSTAAASGDAPDQQPPEQQAADGASGTADGADEGVLFLPAETFGDSPTAPTDAAAEELAAAEARKVWGYPPGAQRLLFDLEEFYDGEVCAGAPNGDLYAKLPEELVRLQRVVPTCSGLPRPPARGAGQPEEGETEPGSCGAHFFWLEAWHDFHSGSYGFHDEDDTGPQAEGRVPFMQLETDVSVMRGSAPASGASAPCVVQ